MGILAVVEGSEGDVVGEGFLSFNGCRRLLHAPLFEGCKEKQRLSILLLVGFEIIAEMMAITTSIEAIPTVAVPLWMAAFLAIFLADCRLGLGLLFFWPPLPMAVRIAGECSTPLWPPPLPALPASRMSVDACMYVRMIGSGGGRRRRRRRLGRRCGRRGL